MQSFSRGWSFLKQAWQMALKDNDLIKPSIFALVAGFIVSVIFIPLMIGAGFLTGGDNSLVGQVVLFVLGAIMIFVQYTIGYIFSAMTVYLIYGYLAEGDGVMSKAWAVVKRDFFDLMSLAAASTAVNLLKNAIKGKGKGKSGGRNFLAGLIDTVWTEAAFLILPAMVIEDINLKNGLKRAGQIIKSNLLLVGISTVGVKAVNGLIGFLLGTTGIALGLGVGLGIVSLTGPEQIIGLVGGIGLGVLIAGVFIMVATVVTSYTATAYHTCLYLWARDVEKAQQSGQSAQVAAPAPLAAVLGK
jgi:membrane-anchored glycerophosphoryl diester phosphodiesterase (GDPDase)